MTDTPFWLPTTISPRSIREGIVTRKVTCRSNCDSRRRRCGGQGINHVEVIRLPRYATGKQKTQER